MPDMPLGHAPLRRDDPRGLSYALAAALKARIAAGDLAPGARVPSESQLCQAFGVSRTVVREAVSQLRAEGLVETFQGRGSFIALTGVRSGAGEADVAAGLGVPRDARDVMELRMALESEAAALAASRRTAADVASLGRALGEFRRAIEASRSAIASDWAFHMAVSAASANPLIVAIMRALGPESILRHRASIDAAGVLDPEHGRLLIHEHAAIHDAIVRGDAEAARASIRVHLARSAAALGT